MKRSIERALLLAALLCAGCLESNPQPFPAQDASVPLDDGDTAYSGSGDGTDKASDGLGGEVALPDGALAEDASDTTGEVAPPSCPGSGDEPVPGRALTTSGPVQGKLEGGVWSWLGIPYAQPPVGDLRWKAPVPVGCFDGVLEASAFGPACPQQDLVSGLVFGEENCLQLNVWSPETAGPEAPVPVLFFIHGGGNSQGSSGRTLPGQHPLYNGFHLAKDRGVLVVTINYRLGPFGFLALPELSEESGQAASGNYGLMDQVLALTWVRDNIRQFGGDPDRVLLFGESAGAVDTCMLMASPLAAGLFSSALMQSAACSALTLEWAEPAYSEWVEKQTQCGAQGPDRLACLRAMDATALVQALPATVGLATMDFGASPSDYAPLVDGFVLPMLPEKAIAAGKHNAVPFAIGTNRDEYDTLLAIPVATQEAYEDLVETTLGFLGQEVVDTVLAMYPVDAYDTPRAALVDLLSDSVFTCPARRVARLVAEHQSAPVVRYFFARRPQTPKGTKPAGHGLELLYVFGTLNDIPLYFPPAEDKNLSAAIMGYWSRFAAAGDPNGDGAVLWPTYDPKTDPYLLLDAVITSDTGLHTDACDFWDELLGKK